MQVVMTRVGKFNEVHLYLPYNNHLQVSQDSGATARIILDVIDDLQTILPAVKEFHLFSDNAGCYKSTETLITLRSHVGEKLKTYNFSEAQDGKGLI